MFIIRYSDPNAFSTDLTPDEIQLVTTPGHDASGTVIELDGPFDNGDELDYYAYLGGLTGNGRSRSSSRRARERRHGQPVAGRGLVPVLVQNIDPGMVFHGGLTGVETSILSSTTSLQANWSGFSDPNGTIDDYQWSIGTYPGGSDVFGPTDVGLPPPPRPTGSRSRGGRFITSRSRRSTIKG